MPWIPSDRELQDETHEDYRGIDAPLREVRPWMSLDDHPGSGEILAGGELLWSEGELDRVRELLSCNLVVHPMPTELAIVMRVLSTGMSLTKTINRLRFEAPIFFRDLLERYYIFSRGIYPQIACVKSGLLFRYIGDSFISRELVHLDEQIRLAQDEIEGLSVSPSASSAGASADEASSSAGGASASAGGGSGSKCATRISLLVEQLRHWTNARDEFRLAQSENRFMDIDYHGDFPAKRGERMMKVVCSVTSDDSPSYWDLRLSNGQFLKRIVIPSGHAIFAMDIAVGMCNVMSGGKTSRIEHRALPPKKVRTVLQFKYLWVN